MHKPRPGIETYIWPWLQGLHALTILGDFRAELLLPSPADVAPRLQRLRLHELFWAPAFLAKLAALPHLEELNLHTPSGLTAIRSQDENQLFGDAPVLVPAMPRLGSLTLSLPSPPRGGLRFGALPALRHLSITFRQQRTMLSAAAAAAQGAPAALDLAPGEGLTFPLLETLSLDVPTAVALDFGRMPALHAARLRLGGGLGGAATLAACTRLTGLELGWAGAFDWSRAGLEPPQAGWVLGLLQALPASVRGLSISAAWHEGAAVLVGQAEQLRALALPAHQMRWALRADAPVWRGL